MNENMYRVTEEEKKIIEARTSEINNKVSEESSIVKALCEYICENGFTKEEAEQLIKETVIPTVDEYNASCSQALEGSIHEWLHDKIPELSEGMGLNNECKIKLALLRAIRGTDITILKHISEIESTGWEAEYQELCGSEEEQLESGEYTEDMLVRINDSLDEAIENSGIILSMSAQFEKFLDGKMDEESIKNFTFEIWKDEKYKYCAATAACVAKHNGELPSIPAETPDRIIVLGICQGIDVDNIEKQVAFGEMAADTAYEILKVIAAVGLALGAIYLVFNVIAATSFLSIEVATAIFGTGIIGGLVAFSLALGLSEGIMDTIGNLVKPAAHMLNTAADFTYKKLKQGAKAVRRFTVDKIMPCVRKSVVCVGNFFHAMARRVHDFTKNKQTVNC